MNVPDVPSFTMRVATSADVPSLARHCVEMYADMGVLPTACHEPLYAEATGFISTALERGEYRAWLAMTSDQPARVIAGAALHLRTAPPRLRRRGNDIEVTSRRQGLVCHVYTEPEWRRHGLASMLLNALLAWTVAEDIPDVFLHASPDGRPLYEQLEFVPTNEMRYAGTPRPAL